MINASFEHIFYGVGAVNGLMIAALLIVKSRGSAANIILSLWCAMLALNFLSAFIHINDTVNAFSFLIGWSYFSPTVYGALLYLYCNKLFTQASLMAKDWLHSLPLLLCYALNVDILFAAPEQKLIYITSAPPFTTGFVLSQALLYAQAFIYGFFTLRSILRHKTSLREQYASGNDNPVNWALALTLLTLFIWTVKLTPLLIPNTNWLFSIGSILIVVLIYFVSIMQWLKPQLFDSEPIVDLSGEQEPSSKHMAKPSLSLDRESHQHISDCIDKLVKEKQLYLQDNLSLATLSEQTAISPHHISETLNSFKGKNFYRYINEFRVEHFCQAIQKTPNEKIIDVAMQSGFSNKSTFNAAFKEIKGITPSTYRKEVRGQDSDSKGSLI
ncbi:MAG: helix-turn-helix domain-containing protein [Pseudomonadota bacterium]